MSDKYFGLIFFTALIGVIAYIGYVTIGQDKELRNFQYEACKGVEGRDYAGCKSQAYMKWRKER